MSNVVGVLSMFIVVCVILATGVVLIELLLRYS